MCQRIKVGQSFTTTDGKVFTEKLDAELHQNALDFRAKMLEEYAAVFTSAPEAKRMLMVMIHDPEAILALLEPYAKRLRKIQKKRDPMKEYNEFPALAAA